MDNKQRTEIYIKAFKENKVIVLGTDCDDFIIPNNIDHAVKQLTVDGTLGDPQDYLNALDFRIKELTNKKDQLIAWMEEKDLYIGNFHFYSSGDGSLDGIWRDDNGNNITKEINKSHMELALKQSRYHHLQDWIPVLIYNTWKLVYPIKRIDDDHLQYNNMNVEYGIDQSYMNGEKITFNSLICYSGEDEIKNHSIISSIVFFLNHEKEITDQS